MPRSYLLLKAMIGGSEVIQPHPIATGNVDQTNWYRHRTGWKMVYNEMVEFWGSLIELARYKVSGELPEQVPGGIQPGYAVEATPSIQDRPQIPSCVSLSAAAFAVHLTPFLLQLGGSVAQWFRGSDLKPLRL